jgi:hypothetical protein
MAAPHRPRAAVVASMGVVAVALAACSGDGRGRAEELADAACALFASAEPAKRSSVDVSVNAADLASTASSLDRQWDVLAGALGSIARFNEMAGRWATEESTVPQLNPDVMATQLRARTVIDDECRRISR